MKKQMRTLLALALIVVVLAMALSGCAKKDETPAGSKTVTVEVVHGDGSTKEFTLHTDAEMLGAALVEDKEINVTGEDSDYGLYITSVDGEAASNDDQTYWAISKDGEMLQVGADSQPVADGEHDELTLTTW